MKKYWWLVIIIILGVAYAFAKPATAPTEPGNSFAGPAQKPFTNGPSEPPPQE